MDNGRPESTEELKHASDGADISEWRHVAPKRGDLRGFEAVITRDQVLHVAFARSEAAVNQQRVVTDRLQPRAHLDRLDRRSADIQARDDAGHPDRWRGESLGHRSATLL